MIALGSEMDAMAWVLVTLLGIGLAASSGLNTFLPLLLLACVAKFQLFNISLNGSFAWLGSDTAIAILALASIVEIAGDKIPAVDHMLDVFGIVARPAAGTLAAASVFRSADPTTATIIGLMVGAPTALGFHTAKAGTRAASSATTFGAANPLLSLLEDVLAVMMTIIAFVAPILVPLLLLLVIFVIVKIVRSLRRRIDSRTRSTPASP